MKKAALFATILALALSATAQESHSVGANVISNHAVSQESANVQGITKLPAPNAQTQSATAKTNPVAAVSANAIPGATASKQIGFCFPLIVLGPSAAPLCK